jgi:ribosome-binding protein aMBF1 (putative translation factor)
VRHGGAEDNPFWDIPDWDSRLLSVTRSAFSRKYARLREILAAARRDRGYTQASLAQQLRRPQSFVSKFERGERRLDVVEFLEIAAALGLDAPRVLREIDRG